MKAMGSESVISASFAVQCTRSRKKNGMWYTVFRTEAKMRRRAVSLAVCAFPPGFFLSIRK